MTVNTTSAFHTIPLDKIKAGENVRDLNADHVDALASSIELVGLLTPVTVASDGKGGYNLVAGFHRFAAASKAGLKEIPAVERASEGTATDAAVENIARRDLTPYEEAVALKRAMEAGLTEDDAATALGWSAQLIHNRQRILAMPEKLQPMAGFEIPLNLVDAIAKLNEDFPLVGQAIAANVIEGERIRNFGEWFLTRMDTGDLDLAIWNISKTFRLDHASDFKPKPKWRAATKRKIAELSKGKESIGQPMPIPSAQLVVDNNKADLVIAACIAFVAGLLIGWGTAEARPVSWNTSTASVYDGVGLGGVTACHGYKPPSWWRSNLTVAHKTLPCGTKVRLLYRGRKVTARVWDRGPFVSGRTWDLDVRVQRRLGFPWGVAPVRWRLLR